jgi:hypothetical protein
MDAEKIKFQKFSFSVRLPRPRDAKVAHLIPVQPEIGGTAGRRYAHSRGIESGPPGAWEVMDFRFVGGIGGRTRRSLDRPGFGYGCAR